MRRAVQMLQECEVSAMIIPKTSGIIKLWHGTRSENDKFAHGNGSAEECKVLSLVHTLRMHAVSCYHPPINYLRYCWMGKLGIWAELYSSPLKSSCSKVEEWQHSAGQLAHRSRVLTDKLDCSVWRFIIFCKLLRTLCPRSTRLI